MAMTASVAVVVASMFVLIFELQYPYRSGMAIGSAAWLGDIDHIDIWKRKAQRCICGCDRSSDGMQGTLPVLAALRCTSGYAALVRCAVPSRPQL